MAKLESFFEVFCDAGMWPGGIRLEAVNQPVTECVGGEADTGRRTEAIPVGL